MKFLFLFILLFSCKNERNVSKYFLSNGGKIHYKLVGNGPQNILFIHGWGCNINAWEHQIDYFKENASLILVDLPGFGKSTKDSLDYNIEFFSNTIQSLLIDLNISDVHLVGHSLGHPIAKRIAESNPNLIKSICIVDGVYFDYPLNETEKTKYSHNLNEFANMFIGEMREQNIKSFINSLFVETTPNYVKTYAQKTMSNVQEYVGYNIMKNLIIEENWKNKQIKTPTLAIYANIPELPENNKKILEKWYSNLDYFEFDSVGHFLMMENPTLFNKTLEDFLNKE